MCSSSFRPVFDAVGCSTALSVIVVSYCSKNQRNSVFFMKKHLSASL
jgi:hypothetical protein